jgi:rhodanese-related sulfurtransferase
MGIEIHSGGKTMNLLSALFGPPIPTLSAKELSEKLKVAKRPLVIDVRQPEEYRQGHIAGAKLIPLGELSNRINELPKDKEIVCVCASGSRSRSATKYLIRQGYNAFDMTGGMIMWQRAKLSVNKK